MTAAPDRSSPTNAESSCDTLVPSTVMFRPGRMRAAYGDPVGLTLYLAAPGVSARAEGRGDDDALAKALADRWPDVGTHVEIHHDRFGGRDDIVIRQVARWLQDDPVGVVEAMRAAARLATVGRR